MPPKQSQGENKSSRRLSGFKFKDIKGDIKSRFGRGEPQVQEVVEPPALPDTPIHNQYATTQKREAARRQADLNYKSTDNLSGRATPSTTYFSSPAATPSAESPFRNPEGSTPGAQSASSYKPRWDPGSYWKNEHEIDGQPITQPSSEASREPLVHSAAPQGTSSQSGAPQLMVELPSEQMIDTEPKELPGEDAPPAKTNQDQDQEEEEEEETMRRQSGNPNGRDSPRATRHHKDSFSERTGGLPSSPDQHKTGASQPPVDTARAAATFVYQPKASSATQRKPVGNPPYPTTQTDIVPHQLVPTRGASMRPETVRAGASRPEASRSEAAWPEDAPSEAAQSRALRSETVHSEVARSVRSETGRSEATPEATGSDAARSETGRSDTFRSQAVRAETSRSEAIQPDHPTNKDHTPDERDRRSDSVRGPDPFNFIHDGSDGDDGQWSHQPTGQHVDSREHRDSSIRNVFRRNGGTQKQHQTLHKSAAQNSNLDDWSRMLKSFQKQHKVPKDPYNDQLGTVLQWAVRELEKRKQAAEDKDQQIKSYLGKVGRLEDDIAKLNSTRDTQNRQLHQMQGDWNKAENSKQKAVAERDSLQNQVRGFRDALKSAEKKLEASQHDYETAVGERSTAQQEAAMYQKHYEQTASELQKATSSYTRVVGERNMARSECNQYWNDAQQKELELENALGINKQLEHNLTTTTNERDAYKQSSDTALARCVKLEGEKKEEIANIQIMYSRQINTLNENAKKKQEELEADIRDMALSNTRVIEEMKAEHEAEIARRDAEAKSLEERFRAKLRADTTRLQNELTAAHKRMASYSNMDDYVATPDDELRSNFLHLAQRINNLNYWVPRPDAYSFDPELDPDNFLTRNAEQGGRNWPKFVRHVCWRIVIRGFFGRSLGFGALGYQGGGGFDALDHLFQVFAVTDPKGTFYKAHVS